MSEGEAERVEPRAPKGGHAARTRVSVPPGHDPAEAARRIAESIACSPAPGARIAAPSERPEKAFAIGQPVAVSKRDGEGASLVRVEGLSGHVLGIRECAAGIDYTVTPAGDCERGGRIYVDRQPYGVTDHELLRWIVGRAIIGPWIWLRIRRVRWRRPRARQRGPSVSAGATSEQRGR